MKKCLRSKRFSRGQALLEYTIVAHAILFLGSVGMLFLFSMMLRALSAYYESIYFVLRSAAM